MNKRICSKKIKQKNKGKVLNLFLLPDFKDHLDQIISDYNKICLPSKSNPYLISTDQGCVYQKLTTLTEIRHHFLVLHNRIDHIKYEIMLPHSPSCVVLSPKTYHFVKHFLNKSLNASMCFAFVLINHDLAFKKFNLDKFLKKFKLGIYSNHQRSN